MRMHASWFGSLRPTGYKVAVRVPRAPTASSPRTRHPDTTSVPPCSGLSRLGLETMEREVSAERRPALTAPARADFQHVWVGEEAGCQVEQRSWDEESKECREIALDFEGLIQGAAWKPRSRSLGADRRQLPVLGQARIDGNIPRANKSLALGPKSLICYINGSYR